MARLIRAKKLSAREALAAHLKQIERVNPKVNAIVTLVPEMAASRRGEGGRDAGAQSSAGSAAWSAGGAQGSARNARHPHYVRIAALQRFRSAPRTIFVVERMARAGAITIGKTNTPEFGAGSQTFNTVFGATHNPYDLTKTCGGSSGGAAVALACGFTPVATGSDAGGSLRNPAAFCNVVGLPAVDWKCAESESGVRMVYPEHQWMFGAFGGGSRASR